ncbi:hypothetical protein EV421DRAFT_1743519 [Armillaria borealis]|uniref:Uncharacterized protein n=1 Tax=Armillaria borealis TaxID=47425 RepID=A0AA39IWG6_9AGAR|nr:hypothetical protein EV421DRAFT_1743519 [Armillaria borealis]
MTLVDATFRSKNTSRQLKISPSSRAFSWFIEAIEPQTHYQPWDCASEEGGYPSMVRSVPRDKSKNTALGDWGSASGKKYARISNGFHITGGGESNPVHGSNILFTRPALGTTISELEDGFLASSQKCLPDLYPNKHENWYSKKMKQTSRCKPQIVARKKVERWNLTAKLGNRTPRISDIMCYAISGWLRACLQRRRRVNEEQPLVHLDQKDERWAFLVRTLTTEEMQYVQCREVYTTSAAILDFCVSLRFGSEIKVLPNSDVLRRYWASGQDEDERGLEKEILRVNGGNVYRDIINIDRARPPVDGKDFRTLILAQKAKDVLKFAIVNMALDSNLDAFAPQAINSGNWGIEERSRRRYLKRWLESDKFSARAIDCLIDTTLPPTYHDDPRV